MKVPSRPNTRYLLPALFIVAVTLVLIPNRASMTSAVKKSATPQASTNPAIVGQWNPVLIPFKTVPLHISLLPNGKILYWGRDKVTNGPNLEDVSGFSNTYVVDPQFFFNDPVGHTTTYFNSTTNLFCSGHSFLPDGRLLVTGGHEKDSAFPFVEGLGDSSVNIFDYNNATNPWSRLTTGMTWGRWYPYNVTLANGDVAILGGRYWTNRSTPSSQPVTDLNPNPEKYIFNPNGQGSIAIYQQDENPYAAPDNYPLLHMIGDGRILVTGVGSRLFDPNDPTLTGHFVGYPSGGITGGPTPGQSKYNGSSALYDVANGQVLVMGGTPGVGGAPVNGAVTANTSIFSDWQSAGSMAFKRKFHTATILPDGKVLVSGGTQCTGGNDIICPDFPTPTSGAAVINPELWSPNAPTVWTTMAPSPSAIPRVYHSIALLLPDATVLVGAGGLPGAYGEPGAGTDTNSPQFRGYGHPDAEIFSPPYLFDSNGNPAVRPVINSVEATKIGLNQAMKVGFTSPSAISSVVLIRLGSVTHGNNQDQRRIPLNFITNGNTLQVTMPATGKVCPPGPYMMFILNANGTPSVAKIITLTTARQPIGGDTVWVEDNLPAGAIPNGIGEGWNWVGANPTPFSGALASQSNIVAGTHQHFFDSATDTLAINAGDKLMAYVYLDPANPPSEIMLQWNDGSWDHRAYWGANLIGWGADGTNSRRFIGPLPPAGQWVRLEVPASLVGLEGRTLNGLAFSMFNGRATWDYAGKTIGSVNVASAANGAFAVASSTVNGNFPESATINGDRTGHTWGTPTGGWNDASEGAYSMDWVRVDFNGTKTISEIDVYTLRDNFATQTTDPTLTETFSTAPNTGFGVTSYDVQYLSGSGWITIDCGTPTNPCGRVVNNNKVRRQFIFPAVQTSAIRVAVHGAAPFTFANNYSRLVEIEAYSGTLNVAQAVPASTLPRATASSTINANFPASAVIDGDRQGRNWGNGGGWNDGTEGQFASDWLQVNFAGTKTINMIDVFTLRDNFASRTDEPTLTETFSTAPNTGYGITSFNVQYWNGSTWVDVPGGQVIWNNNVWRQFTFSPISTSAIRVVVRDSVVWTSIPNNYSRIVEVQAWNVP